MKEEYIYLFHIRDAIQLIEDFTREGERDAKTFSAVTRQLEIIGEASNRLPAEFRQQQSHIPWRKMIDFRNVLIHLYEGVEEQTVWLIIEDKTPELKQNILTLIATFLSGDR